MYTLAQGEKSTLVMIYTQNMLLRGEVITTENIRVNTWLRTQGVPEFIHLIKANVLLFGAGAVKNINYAELYFPTASVIAFHPLPPAENVVDYDVEEKNRQMVPMTALAGTFQFKGKLRISSLSGLGTSIEMAHTSWTSIYEAQVTNPYLPQMPALTIPVILIHPKHVGLALEAE